MDAYFYRSMTTEVRKYVTNIMRNLAESKDPTIMHAYDKLQDGSCFLVVKCHPYVPTSGYKDPCWTIDSFSFWKRNPSTYQSANNTFLPKPLHDDVIKWAFSNNDSWYYKIINCIYQLTKGNNAACNDILNSNSKNNGKDQNQLQGEGNPDSGCYEGSILHCGGNRPQLAAGRHCDQARVEVQRTRARRGEIYLSTRRPEVLGPRLSDRGTQGLPQEGSQAPRGIGIPSYCHGVSGDPDPEGMMINMKSRIEDCTKVGDAFQDKSGTLFVKMS